MYYIRNWTHIRKLAWWEEVTFCCCVCAVPFKKVHWEYVISIQYYSSCTYRNWGVIFYLLGSSYDLALHYWGQWANIVVAYLLFCIQKVSETASLILRSFDVLPPPRQLGYEITFLIFHKWRDRPTQRIFPKAEKRVRAAHWESTSSRAMAQLARKHSSERSRSV